ncbi:MAG: ADP-glyceromanno-heptose 6-epimerase [Candidatus Cloacimonetes bacterium]|nr:ADP-glyceromanno-heptose 6-epimerase [Candidatus Cloacimonadota bacterium]
MIVITGGAGFIGSNLIKKLNIKGIDDILIVDSLGKSEKWKNLVGKKFVDFIHKSEFLEKLQKNCFPNIKTIVHLGACSSTTEKDADYLIANNFHYTKDLLHYSLKNNIRFIYASSAATYGAGEFGYSDELDNINNLQPLNMYGYSKQMVDEFVIKNNFQNRVAGLKFFNVFGPNEYHKNSMVSMVHRAFEQITTTGKVKLFKSNCSDFEDGMQKRDFVYVKDCTNVIWELINNSQVNGIFNLGTGKARTWIDLTNAVFSALGKQPKINFVEMPEILKGKYQNFTEAEMNKLKSHFSDLKMTSLEDAVEDYVNNFLIKENQYN